MIIIDVIQLIMFAICCYYVIISFFSLAIIERPKKEETLHTFALLVAAHNEEAVIEELVESLKNQAYPQDKYRIFVVADNCTDRTADLARMAGADVLERFDTTNRGKGFAMEFAFDKIFNMDENFEYFCVFDADNLVRGDFLEKMNSKINQGYRAVQGYLDSKNPTDNWLTFSYSLWYWLNNRMTQLSRHNLGLGCRLGGTGFAVDSTLIKELGWGATCLAEDIEFTLKLALLDIKVGWAHDAVVYDEKPTHLGVSVNQRKRWAQGISDVSSRYIKPLLKKAIFERSADATHMLMNFWGDTLYMISGAFTGIVFIMSFFAKEGSLSYELFCRMWEEPWRFLFLAVLFIVNNILVIAALYNDNKLDKRIAKNFLGFLIYIATWIPIGIIGVLKRKDTGWFHTPHSGKKK